MRHILLSLCIFASPAMAMDQPPCFGSVADLVTGGGSPGFPQLFVSPSGSGAAIVWACKTTAGWQAYELHGTSKAINACTYEWAHALNRFVISPARFWPVYTQACAAVAPSNPDPQLVKLCSEVSAFSAAWLKGLK